MSEREQLDQLTEPAKEVLRLARKEAERFQHPYIGGEHLLLGLIGEGQGVAAHVLQQLGVELQAVRDTVEFIIGHEDHLVLETIELTPRAKNILRQARDEAHQLKQHLIGTEHLLLGLVREKQGLAAAVLDRLSVTPEQVQKSTFALLGGGSEPPMV